MTATLAALLLFNAAVAEYRAVALPDMRIFVGVQPGPVNEGEHHWAWAKCIPESGVFVVQVAEQTLRRNESESQAVMEVRLRFAAAHEVCHVKLHAQAICAGVIQLQHPARRQEIEDEANHCAIELLAMASGR